MLQSIHSTSLLSARCFGTESLWCQLSEQSKLTVWALIYKTENRSAWKPGCNLWKLPKALQLVWVSVAPLQLSDLHQIKNLIIKIVDKNSNMLQFNLCQYEIAFTWLFWFLQFFNFYSSVSMSHCMSCVYARRILHTIFNKS